MVALIVIPIVVSGFTLIHLHPRFIYRLHRFKNQYLYLRSIKYGLYQYIPSLLIVIAIFILITVIAFW
jgi:hypothetical protein